MNISYNGLHQQIELNFLAKERFLITIKVWRYFNAVAT